MLISDWSSDVCSSDLHLTLAGRYDIEKRSVVELAPDAINPVTGANYNLCIQARGPGTTLADCQASETFKEFEPKASISYDLGRTGSVYASYGKGFKSGGFNPLGSRSEEHTSELQSLMRISYAVFCL